MRFLVELRADLPGAAQPGCRARPARRRAHRPPLDALRRRAARAAPDHLGLSCVGARAPDRTEAVHEIRAGTTSAIASLATSAATASSTPRSRTNRSSSSRPRSRTASPKLPASPRRVTRSTTPTPRSSTRSPRAAGPRRCPPRQRAHQAGRRRVAPRRRRPEDVRDALAAPRVPRLVRRRRSRRGALTPAERESLGVDPRRGRRSPIGPGSTTGGGDRIRPGPVSAAARYLAGHPRRSGARPGRELPPVERRVGGAPRLARQPRGYGIEQSLGLMVNYLYDRSSIALNAGAYLSRDDQDVEPGPQPDQDHQAVADATKRDTELRRFSRCAPSPERSRF